MQALPRYEVNLRNRNIRQALITRWQVRFGQIKRKHCPGEGGSLPSSPTGVKKSTPRRGAKGKGKVIKPESATQEETGKNEDSEECNFGLNFKDDEDEELARFSMS